jgi:hypothetical protein
MAREPIRALHTNAFWRALVDAGVFHQDDKIVRCIIDMKAGDPVVMHIQRWGDERLLEVDWAMLQEAEIREVGKDGDDAP